MHFVDDVDPLFHLGGRKHRLFPQGADVVHAVIGGRVQLHHVHHTALQDAPAGSAAAAGVSVLRMLAVYSPGQDPRAGGLAGAAGADEEIGVGKTSVSHLALQRLGDMLLADDLVKGLWPPFAVQSLIHVPLPPRPAGAGSYSYGS